MIVSLLALALFGCSAADVMTAPIMVNPKNAASALGIDVYAQARSMGQAVPAFRGQETVEVRTYKGTQEVTGPVCNLDSGVYYASFSTPANVVVPDYGPNSPAIFVKCEAQGLLGTTTVDAYNYSAHQRNWGSVGTGVLGAIVIGAVSAATRNEQVDEFRYPKISVKMKPTQ